MRINACSVSALALFALAASTFADSNTQTSPGIGALPNGFSAMGGLIIDMVGANGKRLSAQISPSNLPVGAVQTGQNFWAFWTQTGFDSYTLQTLLGGGLQKVNFRITLEDGDSACPNPVYSAVFRAYSMPYSGAGARVPPMPNPPPSNNYKTQPPGCDFDAGTDLYIAIPLANGSYINAGYMGQATSYQLDNNGNLVASYNGFPGVYALTDPEFNSIPKMGYTPFATTGWFSVPSSQLVTLYNNLVATGSLSLGIWDIDPGDQYYDFTQGVANTITDVPLIPPEIISFTATPSTVVGSGTVTLAWQTGATTSVSINQGVPINSADVNGSVQVTVSTPTTFTLTASSPQGSTTATASVTILPPLNITTPNLPAGLASSPYSQSLAAAGGTAPYKWSLASGNLPAGLTLSTSGTISGTPATAGTATFVVQANDSTVPVQAATLAYTLTVNPALAITTTSFPTAVATSPYTQNLAATGGTTPYTWSISSGSLPPGLTLASNGTISGTPSKTGASTFTVKATDATGPAPQTATQSYTITVGAQLAIQTNTLAAGVVGVPYTQGLAAAGGTAPYTWTLDSGPLAAGLTLSTNGAISGTPTTAGITAFVARVTDSTTPTAQTVTQTFSIYIAGQITIDTTSLPNATAAHPYAQPLNAHNGMQPYIWSLASGTLPTGIALIASGALIGSPNVAGTYTFTLKASDSTNPTPQSATHAYTLTVDPAFTITTSTLPGGSTGVPYSASIQATDGVVPYSFAVVFGSLPPGLTLSPAGQITGTPTQPGIFNMLVRATDSTTPTAQSCDQPLSLTVDSTLSITTPTLAEGIQGVQYTQTLTAINGLQPYTWAVTAGALPDGLSLLLSGTIVGMPTKPGTFNVTIQATDSTQPTPATSTRSYTLTIATPLTITNTSLPNGLTGIPYAAIFTTTGGQPQYNYSITNGSLPAGLTLSPIGTITGTPTAAGTYTITVQVSDSSLTPSVVSKTFTIAVNQPLNITTPATLPSATLYTLYSIQLTTTGGLTPYTWTTQSTLPPGLQLISTGVLIGVPSQAGSYKLDLHLTDATTPVAQAASLTVTLIVTPPLVITNTPFSSILPSVPYSASAQATGGVTPYSWSAAGSLPSGLSLNSDGTLAGVTTASGSYTVQFTVADSANPQNSTTQEFVLLVAAPFAITSTSPLQTAILGKSYSQSLTLAGGKAPYTWSVVGGSLPAGVALGSDGTLSGAPTTAGTANFVAQSKDAANETAIKPLTVLVQPALGILSAKIPPVVTNSVYFHLFQPSDGTPAYHWTLVNGPLPAGLTLTDSGLLTGTTTTTGTFPITIGVTDSTAPTGQTATAQVSLTVIQALIAVTQNFTAPTGVTFSQPLVATGGTAPYTWTIASGALPPGLSLNGATISGIPTTSGQYSFVLNITDATGLTASALYSIAVTQQLSIPLPATSIPNATSNLSYAAVLNAYGGTPPYNWTITSGSLPPRLNLSTTGVISGVPTTVGSYTFTAAVLDTASQTANKQYTIQVQPAPAGLTIPPASAALPAALVGAAYAASLTVNGGTPPYTWSLASGSSLPTGFSLNGASIVGTPATAGTYTFELTVKDANGLSTTSIYVLTVGAGLVITTATLPPAVTGTSYSAALTAAGGTPPYAWSGSLPPGLKLSSAGIISGVPTSIANSSATINVTDSSKPTLTASKTYNLTVQPALAITTTNAPTITQGIAASVTLQATGGTPPYTWSVTGGILPPGLTLSPSGSLTGTPMTAGSYATTFTVADSSSTPLSATAQVLFTVTSALAITTTTLTNAIVGSDYSPVLQAQGGTPPYSWSIISGSLPPGLTLNGSTITGSPTTTGPSSFTVKVTDAGGQSANQPFRLIVVAALTINSTTLPAATVNVPYTYTLQPANGTPPYYWGSMGVFPAGISMDRTGGVLSGVPTAIGSSTFTVVVIDSSTPAQHASTTLTLGVNSTINITTVTLPQATVSLLYRAPLTASGGTPPYNWRVSFGSLPAGLVMTSDGVVTGTPATPGSTQVTIQVTDSQGATASANYTITVNSAPVVTLLISPSSPTINPLTQQPVQVSLASSYPTDVTGQITLTGTQDPDAAFIQNGQSALLIPFIIPAGTTTATFTGGPVLLQSGTSSQPFSINASTNSPPQTATQQFSVFPMPPQITGSSYTPGSGGFTITLQGFSTTREVSQATFQFASATTSSAPYTMSVTDIFKNWYQSPQATGSGIFKYQQPFTLTGDLASVTSVQVTLTNSVGTSVPVTIATEAH